MIAGQAFQKLHRGCPAIEGRCQFQTLYSSWCVGCHRGVRRYPCCCPFRTPTPTICPETLIARAPCSSQRELAGMRRFRSRIPSFRLQTNACDREPVQLPFPTTFPRTLIAKALLQVPPGRKPRSCATPARFHNTARHLLPAPKSELPTIWPRSLMPRHHCRGRLRGNRVAACPQRCSIRILDSGHRPLHSS
jgi:hypothetical protein